MVDLGQKGEYSLLAFFIFNEQKNPSLSAWTSISITLQQIYFASA